MKISLEWLSDFVTWTETDPHVIADKLTLSTAEVEEVEMQGALLRNCCVGEVLSVKRHPDADRLCIAEVKTDKGTKTVVCGGTNVKEGMQVAFAHVGATVKWHGGETMTLAPVKIRGVASEGMICAGEELDLAAQFPPKPEDGERPIIDLTGGGFKTGTPLRDALDLNDAVLHVNNTAITTRPDLFSHLGFARECVALGLATWKKKPAFTLPKSTAKNTITIKNDVPKLVPRYLACALSIDNLGETPDWMKRRLEALGLRSVNLPVDITNYVSLDIGVPMHSFDADDIEGTVHMRLSKKGERIKTLDNKEFDLPEGALILSDDKGVFDLVGIMGGLRSSTKETTKNIFLHALSIDSATIRRAVIATGQRTDAATVYEKGVPPLTTEQGFIRALELFLELIPGATITSAFINEGDNGKPKPITLSMEEAESTLGITVTEKEVTEILTDLECDVAKGTKKGSLKVTPPLHRLRDIAAVHDLIEEIGRIKGFDAVPVTMPMAPLQLPARETRVHRLRDALMETGYWETTPLAFVSPGLLQKCDLPAEDAVAIANPLGEETSLLQTSTLPALLHHAQQNLPRSRGDLPTFQWGRVFANAKPERLELTALLTAKSETALPNDPFLRIKQDIVAALEATGYDVQIEKAKKFPSYAHPGRVARLIEDGAELGLIYEVHPSVRARFDLPFRAAAVTLDLSALLKRPAKIRSAQRIPAFPAVTYDVTVTRTQEQALGEMLTKMHGASELLENVHVHDIYAGKPLTNGQYNLTLRFTYRSPERTLTEAEVKAAHQKVLASAGIRA